MSIETIKNNRIEAIKYFITNNGLERFDSQEVANIYNMITHYAGNYNKK